MFRTLSPLPDSQQETESLDIPTHKELNATNKLHELGSEFYPSWASHETAAPVDVLIPVWWDLKQKIDEAML